MKLSDIIRSGLGPFDTLSPDATVSIGSLTFDLSKEDPEVNLIPLGKDSEGRYTYHINSIGTFDFNSGEWIKDQ